MNGAFLAKGRAVRNANLAVERKANGRGLVSTPRTGGLPVYPPRQWLGLAARYAPSRREELSSFFRVFSAWLGFDSARHVDRLGMQRADRLRDVRRMQSAC